MAACTVCNKPFTFFENISRRSLRCKACDQHLHGIQQSLFANMDHDFYHIGKLSTTEESLVAYLQQVRMPLDLGNPVVERFRYLQSLFAIREGKLPRIRVSLHLDSDEYAHFDMKATYFKPGKNVKQVFGRLIGTNKKCYFISDSGMNSTTIDWNNVVQVEEQVSNVAQTIRQSGQTYVINRRVHTLHISVSKGSGGGGYTVADSLYAKTLVDTIVRLWKRQLVTYAENKTQGSVPDHVKATVYQRDGGRCVQCGNMSDYMEYDHRIPRSRGGPNTVENIQLLCRSCNLKKGNRL